MVERHIVIVDVESSILSSRPKSISPLRDQMKLRQRHVWFRSATERIVFVWEKILSFAFEGSAAELPPSMECSRAKLSSESFALEHFSR